VAVPVGRAGQLDTGVTRWTENSNEDKLYMFILRVYTTSRASNVNTLKHMCLGLSLSSTSFIHSFNHPFRHFSHVYFNIPLIRLWYICSITLLQLVSRDLLALCCLINVCRPMYQYVFIHFFFWLLFSPLIPVFPVCCLFCMLRIVFFETFVSPFSFVYSRQLFQFFYWRSAQTIVLAKREYACDSPPGWLKACFKCV